MHAVKALGQRTAARPGSAWRVGVMPHVQSHAEEKEAAKREAERLAAQEAGLQISEGDVEGAAGNAQVHPRIQRGPEDSRAVPLTAWTVNACCGHAAASVGDSLSGADTCWTGGAKVS